MLGVFPGGPNGWGITVPELASPLDPAGRVLFRTLWSVPACCLVSHNLDQLTRLPQRNLLVVYGLLFVGLLYSVSVWCSIRPLVPLLAPLDPRLADQVFCWKEVASDVSLMSSNNASATKFHLEQECFLALSLSTGRTVTKFAVSYCTKFFPTPLLMVISKFCLVVTFSNRA